MTRLLFRGSGGGANTTIDAGLIRTGRGQGRTWFDNGDGIWLASEPPAGNVRVDLFTAAGVWTNVTFTDSAGNYSFDDLEPGSYYMQFGRLPGKHFTLQNQGSDDSDSDADLSTGTSHLFSVVNNQVLSGVDAGYVEHLVNNFPQGTNKTIAIWEDQIYLFTPDDFGFSDPNDAPQHNFKAIVVRSLPSAGSLTLDGVSVNIGDVIAIADIEDGYLEYAPPLNQYGTNFASWQFAVQDDGGNYLVGGGDTDLVADVISIDVQSVNDSPRGAERNLILSRGVTYVFTRFDFGFSDPSDSPPHNFAAVIIASLPSVGTLKLNGVAVILGQVISTAQIDAGQFTYQAPADITATALTGFEFGVKDDGGTERGGWDISQIPYAVSVTIYPSGEWASQLVNFSSQWPYDPPNYQAIQATGAPNTFAHGDFPTAWATEFADMGQQWIHLRFATPVYATGVTIRETNRVGFVSKVELIATTGVPYVIWEGTDPSIPTNPLSPVELTITFAATSYLTKEVKVYINTNHYTGDWEEIDAVMLYGETTSGGGSGPMGLATGPGGSSSPLGTTRVTSVRKPNLGPFATLSVIGPVRVGTPVTFRFTGPSGTGFRYSFDFNNDGDFTDPGEIRDAISPSATFVFARRGWHVVHGRVRRPDGVFADFWIRIFVE